VLDPALLRPGRFDRHVTVDRPTLRGREEILKVHVRDVPLADDVNLRRIAEGTTGLTGADLRNIVNEAALWATREDHDKVYMSDFDYAIDKTLLGAKREEILQGKEKEKTAYHEAGHALVAWLSKDVERVHKVTVIPRGRALGVTQMVPEEDRFNINEEELYARLAYILGGRAAEHLVYSQYSAGAESDLERATNIARRMVTQWGMSERLGPVSYKLSEEDPFLGREIHQQRHISEHTMQVIDEEIAKILHNASERAERLLRDNRAKLDTLVEALLEKEVLNEREIVELIGPAARNPAESNGKADKHTFGKPARHEEEKAAVGESRDREE
jgi:cell division protease FtsH